VREPLRSSSAKIRSSLLNRVRPDRLVVRPIRLYLRLLHDKLDVSPLGAAHSRAISRAANIPGSRSILAASGAKVVRVDAGEFRSEIEKQGRVVNPCDDNHQGACGSVRRG